MIFDRRFNFWATAFRLMSTFRYIGSGSFSTVNARLIRKICGGPIPALWHVLSGPLASECLGKCHSSVEKSRYERMARMDDDAKVSDILAVNSAGTHAQTPPKGGFYFAYKIYSALIQIIGCKKWQPSGFKRLEFDFVFTQCFVSHGQTPLWPRTFFGRRNVPEPRFF